MIVLRAEQVFGHSDKGCRWLSTAQRFVCDMTAWVAMTTTPGYATVLDNYERIHHGFLPEWTRLVAVWLKAASVNCFL